MHSMRLPQFLTFTAALALTACAGGDAQTSQAPEPAAAAADTGPEVGRVAPGFELTSLEGQPVKLQDYRGQLVVLHFGVSWCPYCAAKAPKVESIHQRYKDRGVAVLVVDIDEGPDEAKKYAAKGNFTCPLLLDTGGKVAASYAPAALFPDLPRHRVPIAATYVIDREGVVRHFAPLKVKEPDPEMASVTQALDELLAAS